MNKVLLSAGFGAITGARSMLGPALVAQRLQRQSHPLGLAQRLLASSSPALTTLAAAEMAADKSARIPPRTAPLPLTGRLLAAGLVGLAVGGRRYRGLAVLAGVAGAAASAFGAARLRRTATARWGLSNRAAGLGEDALLLAAGAGLVSAAIA